MPACRDFARINRPACNHTPGSELSDEGVVVRKEVIIVQADVFNAGPIIIGKLLVTAAPAAVAGRYRLLDDFFNHLRLLIVAEQAADALRQHHPARHTGGGFQGAAKEAATRRRRNRRRGLRSRIGRR